MGNRAVLRAKNWILIRSNFYVSNDLTEDSMEMRLNVDSIKTRIETDLSLFL